MWTKLHVVTIIPTFIALAIATFFIWKWLKDKDEKIKLIPIKIIAVILVVLEIVKQIESALGPGGYPLKNMPFYYCSLFLYLYPVMAFYTGKHKNIVRNLTLCSGTALIALMLIMPNNIYSLANLQAFFTYYDSFHTVFFHNLVVFGTFIIFTLNLYDINPNRDYLYVSLFYLAYCVIVAPIANLLKTNFHYFYANTVGFVENLRQLWISTLGYFLGQTCYVLTTTVLTITFSMAMYCLLYGIVKLKDTIIKKFNKQNNN